MRHGKDRGRIVEKWKCRSADGFIEVPVRLLRDGVTFWVHDPRYNIDIESPNLKELRDKVNGILADVKSTKWTDHLTIKVTHTDRDFPMIDFGKIQLGLTEDGSKVQRENDKSYPSKGWLKSGDFRRYYTSSADESVMFIIESTPENIEAVGAIQDAIGHFWEKFVRMLGARISGKSYTFKASIDQKTLGDALKEIAKKGFRIKFEVGRDEVSRGRKSRKG